SGGGKRRQGRGDEHEPSYGKGVRHAFLFTSTPSTTLSDSCYRIDHRSRHTPTRRPDRTGETRSSAKPLARGRQLIAIPDHDQAIRPCGHLRCAARPPDAGSRGELPPHVSPYLLSFW